MLVPMDDARTFPDVTAAGLTGHALAVRAATDVRVSLSRLRRRLREVTGEQNGGLSGGQASVLARLGKGEATTAAELAALEGVRPQSMATTIASLEAGGLIFRTPDPTDGRRQVVALTEAGRRLERGNLDQRREWLTRTIEGRLSEPEQRMLIEASALLDRLARP